MDGDDDVFGVGGPAAAAPPAALLPPPEAHAAAVAEQGPRAAMEDVHALLRPLPGAGAAQLFLLCDGHGWAARIPAALAEDPELLARDPAAAFSRALPAVDRSVWRS
eukprot:gene13892-7363_t